MGESRRNYSREFKVETVKMVAEGGHKVSEVAHVLFLSPPLQGGVARRAEGVMRKPDSSLSRLYKSGEVVIAKEKG